MATPLALVWDLIAVDKASGVFKRVGAAAEGSAAKTATMGPALAKAGGMIALAGVGVAAVSTKMAIDFQDSTTKLVTGAGESETALAKVRQGILDMAGAVGTGPKQLSEGMYLIESAGFHGAKGLDVLKAAAQGAKVGGADMKVVADGLTTAMKDYNLPTSQAADVTSKLVATVAAGKTTMGDLSTSMAKVLPFSSNLGVSLNETMGAMATMTGNGIHADVAANMLKTTMMSLAAETPKGAAALKGVGLSINGVTKELRTKGLQATLTDITDHIGKKFPKGSADYAIAMKSIMGGTKGMGAALALGGTHAKGFTANVKSITGATADAGGNVKNFTKTQKDLKFQLDSIKAAMGALAIKIGNVLIPVISNIIQFFQKHSTTAKVLGKAILAIAAVLVIYAAGVKTAALVTKLSEIATKAWSAAEIIFKNVMGVAWLIRRTAVVVAQTVATKAAELGTKAWAVAQRVLNAVMKANPIGLVIAAITLLVAGVIYAYTHFKTFHKIVDKVFHFLKTAVVATINFVKSHWKLILAIVTGPIGAIAIFIATHWAKIRAITVGAWNAIRNAVKNALGRVKDAVTSGFGHVVDFVKGIPGKFVAGLGDLGQLLWGAGKALLEGLLGGIKAGFDKVKNFVGGIAGTIKNLKGPIEYDRTLLIDEGHAIMHGLNKGLDLGFAKVKANVAGMGGQLSIGDLDVSASVRAASSAATIGQGGGVTRLHPDDIRAVGQVILAGAGAVAGNAVTNNNGFVGTIGRMA